MSFSSDVKSELCRVRIQKKCCAQAEACGVLLYCKCFAPNEIRIVTSSHSFSQRLPSLFHRAFGIEFDLRGNPSLPGRQIFSISSPEKLTAIRDVCCFNPSEPAHHINFGLLEESHCRNAFLRGAFLAGGSVIDPYKGYHMELSTCHLSVSRELTALLLDMGRNPKTSTRKSNFVTYFKQSEAIEDLLTSIGAPVCAMEIMNAKVEKGLRNGINRRVNCEAANVGKTVDAAMEQRLAIQSLRKSGTLDELSPKLQEAAHLRETYPDLSLSQLAEMCDPPVTKSSLNHRLRKLVSLSKDSTESS